MRKLIDLKTSREAAIVCDNAKCNFEIPASLRNLKRKYLYKKAVWMSKGQRVTQMQLFYWGSIICGVSGFLYAISCIFTGLPYWYSISPLLLLLSYFPLVILKKSFRAFVIFIFHKKRGLLLLYINRPIEWNGKKHYVASHFSEEHKSALLKWTYLSKRTVRNERWLALGNKMMEGNELTDSEKKEYGKKVVFCPQQILDGINESITTDILIYGHENIQPLDDNIRDIMKLTDAHIRDFDLGREIDKCKKDSRSAKQKKYEEIGMKIIKNRKK